MTANRERQATLRELFAAIDASDTEKFLTFLSPSAVFRFGAAAPVQGHAKIGAAVSGFFASIAGVRHELTNVITDGERWVCEGTVTYRRHDGSGISLPFANIFEFDGVLISGYRIYVEIAPLYAESA